MSSSNSLKTIFIANSPESAALASKGGADLIMVDLEKAGKMERQKHLSAHFATTDWADVATIRAAIPDQQMMVRLDPWNPKSSPAQIDRAVNVGANRLMLPMIEALDDVVSFAVALAGRADLTPLIETIASIGFIDKISALPHVDRIHIGLNDLHLQLNNSFLFEPLANGVIDTAVENMSSADVAFGFGGIGSLSSTPPISPDMLLGEHARLGSTWVILSRQFRSVVEASKNPLAMRQEISALKARYRILQNRDKESVDIDRQKFATQVRAYVTQNRARYKD